MNSSTHLGFDLTHEIGVVKGLVGLGCLPLTLLIYTGWQYPVVHGDTKLRKKTLRLLVTVGGLVSYLSFSIDSFLSSNISIILLSNISIIRFAPRRINTEIRIILIR